MCTMVQELVAYETIHGIPKKPWVLKSFVTVNCETLYTPFIKVKCDNNISTQWCNNSDFGVK